MAKYVRSDNSLPCSLKLYILLIVSVYTNETNACPMCAMPLSMRGCNHFFPIRYSLHRHEPNLSCFRCPVGQSLPTTTYASIAVLLENWLPDIHQLHVIIKYLGTPSNDFIESISSESVSYYWSLAVVGALFMRHLKLPVLLFLIIYRSNWPTVFP